MNAIVWRIGKQAKMQNGEFVLPLHEIANLSTYAIVKALNHAANYYGIRLKKVSRGKFTTATFVV